MRVFLRLCFRDGETLLFLRKICLSRRAVCEAVAPAAHFGCRVVLLPKKRDKRDENEDCIEHWTRPSHVSVHNKL